MGFRNLLLCCSLAAPSLAAAQACVTDADCNDRVFCNGAELCAPGAPGADGHGCVAAEQPPCQFGSSCHEGSQRCEVFRDDQDGDGHWSIATGGDDCNDSDRNEFPGNAEMWDDADHDEDCVAQTHGFTPGFGNTQRSGRFQACSGEKLVTLTGTVGGDASFVESACPEGSACVSQPSGDGFCLPPPPGYVAGPPLGGPRGDQVMVVAATNAPAAPAMPVSSRAPAMKMMTPKLEGPASVAPSAAAPPALAAPGCLPPTIRNSSGACEFPAGTCADGMVLDEKSKQCVKK